MMPGLKIVFQSLLILLISYVQQSLAINVVWSATNITQTTVDVFRGSVNSRGVTAGVSGALQVIKIEVVFVAGGASTETIDIVTCNTNGTTAVADLTNARLYTTGTSAVFSTITQFGATIANPNGALTFDGTDIPVSAAQSNYFWLTYDISSTATAANVIDGECTNVILLSGTQTTVTPAAAGTRSITNVYTVSSNANGTTTDGTSLRWAITEANLNTSTDIIQFNLGGAGGPFAIGLTSVLPNIATDNNGLTIDGFSNTGNNGTANSTAVFSATVGTPMNQTYKVILDNNNNLATGLIITSNNNIIKGLVLQNFGDGTVSINDIAITISGASNQVIGCNIGIDYTGVTRGTKTCFGIQISGSNNTIGNGTAAGANLISGLNTVGQGIRIAGAGATGNTIKGNMIGLQKDGTTNVAGQNQLGIFIFNSAASNTIGGAASGEGNVISGSSNGIQLNAAGAAGNAIIGNIIGLCADGLTKTSTTQDYGIYIYDSPNNTIGGNSATGYKNIISGNNSSGIGMGIRIEGSNSTGNIIKGNYVGIAGNGTTLVSGVTQLVGIYIANLAPSVTIGGTGAGEGNIISGNTYGVFIGASTGSTIIGNIIGPQADGLTNISSNAQSHGIYISNTPNNTIGGNSTTGYKNIISANLTAGIYIEGAGSTGNVVKGNYIGIAGNGTSLIAGSTQPYGIYIENSAASNTIGSATANEGNVISGNTTAGLLINNSGTANVIKGNYIGTDKNGTANLGNTSHGIAFTGTSASNTVGGTAANESNIIGYNGGDGINVSGASANFNLITRNSIFCNTGKGINLNGTGNGNLAAPVITTSSPAGASGTALANATVELFYSHSCSGCQGKTYVTTATADGSGNWTYSGALTGGAQLTATAISTTNNSSEFTACTLPLPIELLSFNARVINDQNVLTEWTTATETNNDYFTVERSVNGVSFEPIATVDGAGNSSQMLNYFAIDYNPFNGTSYYRLKQTDFDGKYSYSNIVAAELIQNGSAFTIFPNPAPHGESIRLNFNVNETKNVLVVVYDGNGKQVFSKINIVEKGNGQVIAIDPNNILSSGVYVISATSDNTINKQKLIIR